MILSGSTLCLMRRGSGPNLFHFRRSYSWRYSFHAVVQPCFVDVPAWEAQPGLAGELSPSERSGLFMRLHESAGNNDKRLIIWDQADLLPNPTPQLKPGRTSPTPAWEEDESKNMYPRNVSFTFPRFTTMAPGRDLVPGLFLDLSNHNALSLQGGTNELMQRKSLTCRHPRTTERN